MGTRGYRVYRYREMFFIKYNNRDSYPESLGVDILESMRRSGAIEWKREELEEVLDELGGPYSPDSDDDFDIRIVKERPWTDLFIEWIYEIDLDRNIFHVNGIPFFSLECLPDSTAFLEYVTKDHYGHITCPPTCPPEQKYKLSAPPVVDDSDIATYQSLVCTGTQVALSDLLAISDALSPDENVRVSLLEALVGQYLVRRDVAYITHDLGLISGPEQLTDDFWLVASSMANLAFVPQMFDSKYISHEDLDLQEELTWVRGDTVLFISTHLHDERCLQVALSRLIDEILEQKDTGDYFGVAFSLFRCAIIKVVIDEHTTTFSHTAAFEFLPTFHADSPSTPGITALARLGYRIDPELFERATEIYHRYGIGESKERTEDEKLLAQGTNDAPSNVHVVLPTELWREIALHLRLPDLLTFGLVSQLFREVASMILRYPHICGFRLVAVIEKPERMMEDYLFLRASSFSAERAGIPATVLVGLGSDHGWDRWEDREDWIISMHIPYASRSHSVLVSVEIKPDSSALKMKESESSHSIEHSSDADVGDTVTDLTVV
ncbi:hypothetical protein M405DRAFT_884791 [Rhizopogon salebrosus TDB-379]|nr:hypothetical protein M405DRAFT_884791 [Rhizopogon salebrosus TDB-379]